MLPEFQSLIPLEPLMRMTLAVVAASLIGWERERRDKPAGLRTHMMVSLGAATFVLVTMQLMQSLDPQANIRFDPIRVIAGIVGGVGFLGAGSIIHSRGSVEGITTAASIWVAAGIGTASGLGMYGIVFSVACLSLLILAVVGAIQFRLLHKSDNKQD